MANAKLGAATRGQGDLWEEIGRLWDSQQYVLSTAGGLVDGLVTFGDHVQFEAIYPAPAVPRENTVAIYVKTDGHPYAKDWNGLEYDLTGLNGLDVVFSPVSAKYLVLEEHEKLTAERVFVAGDGLAGVDSGAGAAFS